MQAVKPGADTQQVLAGMCPYLLSEDGAWRAARPMREHRCTAVRPPAPLSADKQRRLCLVEAHRTCPAFEAAQDRRAAELARAGISSYALAARQNRPLARTTPVALDRPTAVSSPRALVAGYERLGQIGLVALILLAGLALVVARVLPSDNAGAARSPSPSLAAAATASAAASDPRESPSDRPEPTRTPRRTERPSPTRPAQPETYTVKRGDTLTEIAERFDTTVAVLQRLNSIANPSQLRVGQELKLPQQ
ncbi:MAG: LysM peptidoglycan-binding domain-containing protein [Candidatus Limnocylindrales bacterium]